MELKSVVDLLEFDASATGLAGKIERFEETSAMRRAQQPCTQIVDLMLACARGSDISATGECPTRSPGFEVVEIGGHHLRDETCRDRIAPAIVTASIITMSDAPMAVETASLRGWMRPWNLFLASPRRSSSRNRRPTISRRVRRQKLAGGATLSSGPSHSIPPQRAVPFSSGNGALACRAAAWSESRKLGTRRV
jgi:hypothetical protein